MSKRAPLFALAALVLLAATAAHADDPALASRCR
jgi:hypothetical protein